MIASLCFVLLSFASSNAYPDYFNFDESDFKNNIFGPHDWDLVRCKDVESCPGWPTNWDDLGQFIPYTSNSNMCKDCSMSDQGKCYKHTQSPIDLERDVTALRECNDRHRMRYWKGECRFNKMEFEILPHVLRAYQPEDGCSGKDQPQIDFSRGFPVPWILSHTDIAVPSHHVIEGVQYDAEVMLAHTYTIDKLDRLQGKVRDRYDFLDLYLVRWEKEANRVYRKCFGEDKARKLGADLSSAFLDLDEDHDEDVDRKLEEEYELHDPKHPDDESEPRTVSKYYYDREWHPYDWYAKANTEYYFRYHGSLPEPPCVETTHWRVLKDPVKVAPSQLRALHALIKGRVDPKTCEFETAAKIPNPTAKKISVNRPLQTTTMRHKLVYCECNDWGSKSGKDLDHCKLSDKDRGIKKFKGISGQSLSSTPSFLPADDQSPSPQPTDV